MTSCASTAGVSTLIFKQCELSTLADVAHGGSERSPIAESISSKKKKEEEQHRAGKTQRGTRNEHYWSAPDADRAAGREGQLSSGEGDTVSAARPDEN